MSESRVYLLNLDEQNTNDVVSTNQLPLVTKEVTFLRNHSVRQIACGVTQTVFVLFDGSVYSYEHDEIKNDKELPNPKRLSSLGKYFIVQAACGDSHSVVISDKGQIMSWGRDIEGQCGRGNVNLDGRPTPRVIKSLSNENIVQVACGSKHTLALAKNGTLYAWGDNSTGQLGFGPTPEVVCAVPTQVSCLNGLPIKHICCGGNHSLALMFSGAVIGWGCNKFGQLGGYDKKSSYRMNATSTSNHYDELRMKSYPSFKAVFVEKDRVQIGGVSQLIKTQCQVITAMPEYKSKSFEELRLEYNVFSLSKAPQKLKLGLQPVEQISAGENHSVFVSKNSKGFGFGRPFNDTSIWSNKLEELSQEKDKVLICSRLQSMIFIPSKDKLYVFGPTASAECPSTALNQINELVTESGRTESNTNSFKEFESLSSHTNLDTPIFLVRVYGGGHLCYLISSNQLSQLVISPQKITYNQIVCQLDEDSVSQLASFSEPVPKEILLLIHNLFSTACLNRSFLTSDDHDCCEDSPCLDISRAKHSFKSLSEKHHVLSKISEVIHTKLCPSLLSLLSSPLDLEALRIYLLLLEFPTMQYPEFYLPSIYSVAKALCKLSPEMSRVIEGWLGSYSPQDFQHLVVTFKNVVVYFVMENMNLFPIHTNAKDVTNVLDMLNKLYKINEKKREIIPYTSFYVPEVKLLIKWWDNNRLPHTVNFRNYPCVLENEIKVFTTIFINSLQKMDAVDNQIRQIIPLWLRNPFLAPPGMSDLFLNVIIDRQNIVSSTIIEFHNCDLEDFKKPLKIKFRFEPGQDDGALRKEYFQLIFKEVLDPNFGMFKVFSKTEKLWFNPQSFEDTSMFQLVGILCGLAIYNQVIVDLPFPEVFYKKLCKKSIYLSDLKDLDPTITESLQGILDYDDFDLQDVYDVCFEFSSEFNETVQIVELKEGGSEIPLTYDNKQEYVDLYIDFLLNKSVKSQYEAFEEGFLQVFDKSLLEMFHPQELMLMIIGNKIYDWEEFERLVEYRGSFNKEHQTIKFFWDVFHEFTIEEKKKFLEFLTGSDRISIHGMSHLRVIIEPPIDNDSTDLLPTAQTCYNCLFLPLYETKEKMRQKLLITLENSVGFGLI